MKIGGWLLMRKNDLLKSGSMVIRVLEMKDNKAFVIDCIKRTVPKWINISDLRDCDTVGEKDLMTLTGASFPDLETIDAVSSKIINKRFTAISKILPFVSDFRKRNRLLTNISFAEGISRQTLLKYLCLYLAFQNKAALAPKACISDSKLTADEKNMRWALNKYFYNQNKNSLKTAYTFMLKEKYCTGGVLHETYPTYNQFRYFYRKNKNLRNYYISRDGLKSYQRSHRPLLGNGVQEFAPNVGAGMLDSTICDIYLVNNDGKLVGRPILTACIDAYSGLCCGYSLSWEGGVYSLRGLMLNIIADKSLWCKRHGVTIEKSQWACDSIPAVLVTDKGNEYKSENFEQLAELGIKIVNLPTYRPELKGSVEKFFDLIQGMFKPYLKKHGVIEPDFQERGAHDYRKDACLTMEQFERIIIRCIIYYNSERVLDNFPYTDEMLSAEVQPYASSVWNYGCKQAGANLIRVKRQKLIMTLLPRTRGKFTRSGLIVNKLRYRNDEYIENYLSGGEALTAYNPDDVSCVWLIENGEYVRFELIDGRYMNRRADEVESLNRQHNRLISSAERAETQSQIDLAAHILAIAENAERQADVCMKNIRSTREKERSETHIDFMNGGELYE